MGHDLFWNLLIRLTRAFTITSTTLQPMAFRSCSAMLYGKGGGVGRKPHGRGGGDSDVGRKLHERKVTAATSAGSFIGGRRWQEAL
jgi:hypothetical protein